jgi:tetratricopeptide (TPR) repeat protein
VLGLLGGARAADAQQTRAQAAAPAVQTADPIAQAYEQFLLGRRLEDANDVDGAIAAYKRAMALDPQSAEIPSDLADLYMRRNRASDAIAAAEQALKISPDHLGAHRVLGTIYGSMGTSDNTRAGREARRENLAKGIQHLEKAIGPATGRAVGNVNVRAMLARLYVANGQYDEGIALLGELVKEEPGWQDGAVLLAEAYRAAGRSDEAIKWLEDAAPGNPELYATLADYYSRAQRWQDASAAYEKSLASSPRNGFEIRLQYASMLLGARRSDDESIRRARDVLREAVAIRASERALYLLSQAERRAGDVDAAERTARRLISQNSANPRGYAALAEVFEERRRFQQIADEIAPAVATFRGGNDAAAALSMLLPHLGFAYQQIGQAEKAVAAFEEALTLAPGDAALTFYLIQAQIGAKRYAAAAALAQAARTKQPDDLGLARLEAEALRQLGKADQGIALLEDLLKRRADDSSAHIALAQVYADANRGAQAVKVLQEAQARFPAETAVTFELGAVLEKQRKFSDAEAVFRQVIARDPAHAPALNYLGYMLADRGERLSESVDLIKRALEVEPDNGSYLDSLGWAYYKEGKLDLAEENLKRAADQLLANSVVQDHYGDVLFRLGRFDDAIAAWSRALTGDGENVDRGEIDRKIRSAREKLAKR